MRIAISAESTIDLTKELLQEFDIHVIPFTIVMDEKEAFDGDVLPDELFAYTDKTGKLARTSAVNEFQYEEHFRKLLGEYDAVLHFSLSSKLSSACKNAQSAAKKFENVAVIDTQSLSTGIALQAIYGAKLAKAGKDFKEIVKLCEARVSATQASFSLESVNYLYKGGRCSMLKMLGANLLKLKPEIYVKDGGMVPGAKYRGPMGKVVEQYIADTLKEFNNPDKSVAFVTYSTAPEEVVEASIKALKDAGFETVYPTRAGGTISCHCGPHCLGILYINDGPHPID